MDDFIGMAGYFAFSLVGKTGNKKLSLQGLRSLPTYGPES
jgi:hypothetical protein